MSHFFHIIISEPFYNGFIALINLLPFLDAGVVIIIFTIIIKFILFPLSLKASRAQIEMKSIEKDLNLIKEKYPDKNEQGQKTIEYYKEKGINPFAGFFVLLIQLPIIIGLYRVFLKSGLPLVNASMLYSFVAVPASINMVFLHIINIAEKSIVLAIIAGVTTYFQISLANPKQPESNSNSTGMKADIGKAMAMQMKYFFPILVIFISYSISAAVAIYWITSNVFQIFQDIYTRKKYSVVVVK